MLESLFAILFKYRPAIFEQGEFRFAIASSTSLLVVGMAAGAASALLTYRGVKGDSARRDRLVLAALRLAAIGIAAFCLFRPVLILRAAVPQQNFVGIVIDDSRSMRIADREGETRSAFVGEQFGSPDSPLLKALSQRFVIRTFRFASSAERIASASELSFAGTQTRLGEALVRVREDLAGLPLAGIVMVTDGADTTSAAITDALLPLKADAVPVFTLGVGRETVPRDIQVSRVSTPRSVLKGTSLVVDVVLTQSGFRGASVPLNVESDGRIISTQQVALPADGEPTTVRIRFTAADAGQKIFRFRVPPQEGESITQNNAREALVDVQDRVEKILYFEGEPRWEMKFIGRAVSEDKNLQLVVLQRTAENKYLRIRVDGGEELAAGFPKTREELFAYRGLILGSVEAGAFTGDQLRMIAEFVDRRGGGLLMLGGRRAFAEGGYAGTPVAEVLPLVIEGAAQPASRYLARLTVKPTRAGATHPVTQLGATEQESNTKWSSLNAATDVTSVNQVRGLKPGATALLMGNDSSGRDQVVLAYQRYGRGKAIALPIQDSWNWQMAAKIPVEDLTHENLWRQLLRWLVDGVPGPVELTTTPDRVEPGQRVTLTANVSDSTFVEVNNAHVVAHVVSPSGAVADVPMQWTGDRNGEYRATFEPAEDGVHKTSVDARRDDKPLGETSSYVRATADDSEYFDAAMRTPLLKRIASETGGRFYTRDNASSLAEDLKYTGRGVSIVEERELWDMPIVLVLLVSAVLSEWGYRRARGLA